MFGRWLLVMLMLPGVSVQAGGDQTRPADSEAELRDWLQNMRWYHHYSDEEMRQVTGLTQQQLSEALRRFRIDPGQPPPRHHDKLLVLPYPGGRHPRIGFLEGAIDPQRETKLSVFCPWDDSSYAVLDVPEAIWSNLGLTYLAHTHVDTIWTRQGMSLPQQEWQALPDGSFVSERRLPNGIVFGTKAVPLNDHVRLKMWLTNGTDHPLTDLRVQNCVMLKGMRGFEAQHNDNKVFVGGFAAAESADGRRWVITAWDPLHRAWGNAKCPCLHSDPRFPDCAPGETVWLRGWFSFYQGSDIQAELKRIDATGWRQRPLHHVTGNLVGRVRDAATGRLLPARVYVQNVADGTWHFASSTAVDGDAVTYNKQLGKTPSIERHTALSADPFQLTLPPGSYRIWAERGKEWLPTEVVVEISADQPRQEVQLPLRRIVDMAASGWYSGDTHVHRPIAELPTAMLADDLNVALPLTWWVRDSRGVPAASGPPVEPRVREVDATHVIYPVNTEYEIFTVDGRRHTQGAVFVLNHKTPLRITAPPVRPVAEEARRQGAILDLDKHSWNWSLMAIPVMDVDLFELSNNHHWRTQFGFPQWTLEHAPPDWPEIERNEHGFTEAGWTHFGFQTYYALVNCGFRMRVSGGTASGVHPVPLGYGRVYVHVDNQFSFARWIENLNAGRSFVSNGPLLDVRFNDRLPGERWVTEQATTIVRVQGEAISTEPLLALEIVRNGEVVSHMRAAGIAGSEGGWKFPFDTTVEVPGSGWIAVRCFSEIPDKAPAFAHTNPVYIDHAGRPLVPRRRDVAWFVQRMQQELKRNTGVLSPAALGEYREALAVYEKLLSVAR